MMKQFLSALMTLACMLSLSGLAGAVALEYYGIEDTIQDDLTIKNLITLKFDKPISHLDYMLNFMVSELEATSTFDSAECGVSYEGEKSKISCDFIGMTREKNTLILDFVSTDGVQRTETGYIFSVNYGVSLPVKRAFVLIKLPRNGILAKEVANESYSPPDGKTLTDGRHILVSWERLNLSSGSDLQFSVLYTVPIIGGQLFNLVVLTLTVVVVIAMFGVAFYIRRGTEEKKPETEIVKSVLNRDEKTIVDILNSHEGKAGQKLLVRESDFSKAKVSRLVKNLNQRGIVEIEPISGRENRIILKITG